MKSHELTFDGDWLERGFWLYEWEVTVPRRKAPLHYVGRTGDSSSLNAASPFNRMGQHLDLRTSASAAMLTKNLRACGVGPEQLPRYRYRFVAVGTILNETRPLDARTPSDAERTEHHLRRDHVAALERDLAITMRSVGYAIINEVNSRMATDPRTWRSVRREFAEHFPKLREVTNDGG
jgi:hypothetical protein